MIATSLCTLLGIRHPILQAPMAGGPTTPELVAAVSNAGGLGSLAAGRLTLDQLARAIRNTRALTSRPFGVNFLLAPPEGDPDGIAQVQAVLDRVRSRRGLPRGEAVSLPASPLPAQLDLVAEERIPVVSFAMGDPGPLVRRFQERGARVLGTATTVAEARRIAEAGVDAVVAQGAEAGGHRSTLAPASGAEPPLIGTMVLVPQVVDAVSIPVIAAGGIADGRGVAAALALGAAGVAVGTRFLTARESGAMRFWKERVLRSQPEDSCVTDGFTGRHARALPNAFLEAWRRGRRRPLPWPWQGLAAQDIYLHAAGTGDGEAFPLLAGQVGPLCRADQPAAAIVAELVAEARAVIERLPAVLNPAPR